MMSSVMPSLKYSCSGSPLMLLNGRTAIDGRSSFIEAYSAEIRFLQENIINPNRLLDILQLLLAAVFKSQIEPVADVIAHRLRNGDAARLCQALEPCRDVDPVAVDVVAFDDDIAEVYADAKLDRALGHVRARIAV